MLLPKLLTESQAWSWAQVDGSRKRGIDSCETSHDSVVRIICEVDDESWRRRKASWGTSDLTCHCSVIDCIVLLQSSCYQCSSIGTDCFGNASSLEPSGQRWPCKCKWFILLTPSVCLLKSIADWPPHLYKHSKPQCYPRALSNCRFPWACQAVD